MAGSYDIKENSNSAEKCFLAIDAGTTIVKAALTNLDGEFIDIASKKLEVLMPHQGWCEMDMDAVFKAVLEVSSQLSENNAASWENICAIGICAQGDGMWPIDVEGKPVRNAVLWNDTRAGDLLDYETINKACLDLGTTPLFPGANLIILRWLKENEPESYKQIARVLHCKDWLNYKLTGRIITDQTDASTALLNIYTKKYEFSLLKLLGIQECEGYFPSVVASDEIIGTVTDNVSALLKIKAGTPVITGAIDVLAVATGCDVTKTLKKGSILGTTLCNYIVLDRYGAQENAGENGEVLCHTKPDVYIKLMAALSGASALDWVRQEILDNEPFAEFENKIAKIPIGSDGVFFQPYLYGERAPFHNAKASSGFFGLRPYHTKYHMARAAYEGFTLSLLDCYKNLPHGENGFVVAGGAAKSDVVCQMICDCMGEKTVRYKGKELGISGVVSLLQNATKLGKCEYQTETDEFLPDSKRNEEFKKLYTDFSKLKIIMEPFWGRDNSGF